MASASKRAAGSTGSSNNSKALPLAKVKANLSSVVSNVQNKRTTITILRRGLPVAQIVPVNEQPVSLYGCMRGTVREIGDIVGPTGIEWTVGDEQ
jgi:antitoxin (DNA-binding transcriptional repressor) of toxin-antitoxin stability system